MQCACAVLYCHPWPGRLYKSFPHYLINSMIFWGKIFLNIKWAFWLSPRLLSEKFLILKRTEHDVIKMYMGGHVKYRLFLPDFKETWIFFDIFSKNTQISNFTKNRPVGAELLHADRRRDRQTDVTKLLVAFRNFAKAPKMHAHSFNSSNTLFRINGSWSCGDTPFSSSGFSSSWHRQR